MANLDYTLSVQPASKYLLMEFDWSFEIDSREKFLAAMDEVNTMLIELARYSQMLFPKSETVVDTTSQPITVKPTTTIVDTTPKQWHVAPMTTEKSPLFDESKSIFDKYKPFTNTLKVGDILWNFRIQSSDTKNNEWREVYTCMSVKNGKTYTMQLCPACKKQLAYESTIQKNYMCSGCLAKTAYTPKKKVGFNPNSPEWRRLLQSIW